MRTIFCFFILSFLVLAVSPAKAQENGSRRGNSQINVTDLCSRAGSSDGNLYIVDGNYYVSDSYDSLKSNLKIDPQNYVVQRTILMLDNPYSRPRVENIKNRLPEEYRSKITRAIVSIEYRRR